MVLIIKIIKIALCLDEQLLHYMSSFFSFGSIILHLTLCNGEIMFACTTGMKLLKIRSSVIYTKRPFKVRDLNSQWDDNFKFYSSDTKGTEKIFVLIYFHTYMYSYIYQLIWSSLCMYCMSVQGQCQ